MYKRNLYLNRITPFIDKPVIKIITGMRRVGKSCFLKLVINHLEKNNATKHQIVYINKESLEYDFIRNHRDLYEYTKKEFNTANEKKYLFIDEIQEIETWERAVNSIFSEGKVDIFITGSNARLLSSELATLLSGRFVDFQMFSLGFQEYIEFREEKTVGYEKLFQEYLKFGGFPAIHHFKLDEETIYQYVNGIYNTILLKDVVKRNSVRNLSLLDNLTRYIFDNVGNVFSAKRITDYLKSQKMKVGIESRNRNGTELSVISEFDLCDSQSISIRS